jgi:uncharacterized protein (TIGR02246 family)
MARAPADGDHASIPTPTEGGNMTARDEITALLEGFCEPWNAGDIAGVAARYTQDGRLISPFGHDARGRDAVRELYQQWLGDGPLQGSQTTMEVEDVRLLSGDVAIADCRQVIDGSDLGRLDLHLITAVTSSEQGWLIAEARPYAFLPLPVPAS